MSKTVLLIDDSEVFRKIVRVYLKNANFEILESGDGQQGLDLLESGQKVNLIVCDVNMPNMDGLTFIKKIKEHPKLKFTPIIMLTTESEEDKKRQGMEAGVKAWLVKPFSPEELLKAINKILV